MIGIVDTYEAMTSVRPYRDPAFSVEDTLKTIREQAPDKYDAQIANIFSNMIEETLGLDSNYGVPDTDYSALHMLESQNPSGRRYQRVHFRLPAALRRISRVNNQPTLGAKEEIIVHNISKNGVGLISPRPLELDRNFCITIAKNRSGTSLHFIAVAVRCTDHGGGWFTVGGQFQKILDHNELEKVRSAAFFNRETAPSPRTVQRFYLG
jgi:hypothetical protein